ncbi:insecticidal toxin protein [Allorhizocola rhizosphaerae]|uniref:Tc toxin subunit A-related protein n=1 Tax=Allorhizocola rhizosphaerae TaxID=1872709 RepID=UPI000E3D4762|nr:insecticidal toxin protein [Allorhizocola rhizosphaerae]
MALEVKTTLAPSFHGAWLADNRLVAELPAPGPTLKKIRLLQYRFHAHFHPYVNDLINRMINGSVRGLQDADTATPALLEKLFTQTRYDPSSLLVVDSDVHKHPVADLDFSSGGGYSVYNWELFYHIPITIAIHLSRNQRYAEAQHWLHYLFDPMDDSDGPTPERYWKVRPFREGDPTLIEKVLINLSTGADQNLWEETVDAIGKWKDTPFRPHAVARYRHTAYMFKAVMTYLDNLIEWGDSLFRQDTGEAINEATQLYVLAANLLGPRPMEVPAKGKQAPQTYASLRGKLDAFGNALTEVEVDLPFDVLTSVSPPADAAPLAAVRSIATSLYFCVPRNDKLLGYWDTVADRLFKIRNSLDIHGVFRRLPLFDPPIDPALLAKAAAAGLDVGTIVAGLGQPLPLVRFSLLVAKASEICQEVKSLGGQLLSAIEKQDAEALAILRAKQERTMLGLAELVRYGQWQEAIKAREALEKGFQGAVAKLTYYERLLGTDPGDIDVPSLDGLDADALAKLRLNAREPDIAHRDIDVDIAEDTADGNKISSYEDKELDLLSASQALQDTAAGLDTLGTVLGMIPGFEAAAKPMGAGAGVHFGGLHLSEVARAGASAARGVADRLNFEATQAGKIGGYQRRQQEWTYQRNLVASEITQIYRQWRAAQIREALAEREWHNHQKQIRHAEDIEDFLTDPRRKTSNVELYAWLRREVRGLYGQWFQFAFDIAKRAERALQHELGDSGQTFLRYGYQSGKEGLLAGERLALDIKRMEMAYHELNRREYELTTHVSLRQLDPVALLTLRATGACEFAIPEELLDLIGTPGHYFRRLKSVALSIPAVVGPYTGVNATLTLQRSSIRTTAALGSDGYGRTGDEDTRFSDHLGAVQSVVTSSGQQDSGLFEVNLRDERYLPFEGSGAISTWRLELPAALPQFDHDTISDVVLHLRYTAREGGAPLRAAAQAHVAQEVAGAATAGSVRMLSVRQEFPTEWARFTATAGAPLTITLREEHYPYWSRAVAQPALHKVQLFAQPGPATKNTVRVTLTQAGDAGNDLTADPALGGLRVGELAEDPLPKATGPLTLFLDDNTMDDLWLALTWGGPVS